MPRGRRRLSLDVSTLEQQLTELKQRQAELRVQLRKLRNSSGEVSKLEEKLQKQLAGAKWTARQIQELKPDWDEVGFYQSVTPRQPAPRGRRKRATAEA
jgi:chromosome segregation ATPase